MDHPLEGPLAGGQPGARPRAGALGRELRRLTPNRVALGLTALVVLAAVAGGLWWRQAAWGYNGLGPGSAGGVGMPGGVDPAEHQQRQTDDFEHRYETVFTYRPGATFRTGFTVANTGKHDVRITGVSPIGAWFLAREQAHVGVDDRNQAGGGGPTGRVVPLRPFTLAPGSERWIEVEYRFGPCPAGPNQGGSSSWDSQQVEYTVLGVHRRVEIGLFSRAVVENPPPPCEDGG
jgi:hypothetical protein